MISYHVLLDDTAAAFYRRIADLTGQPVETVLADSLFKLAGELSLEAISERERQIREQNGR